MQLQDPKLGFDFEWVECNVHAFLVILPFPLLFRSLHKCSLPPDHQEYYYSNFKNWFQSADNFTCEVILQSGIKSRIYAKGTGTPLVRYNSAPLVP